MAVLHTLSDHAKDRAAGVLLGNACGDALGVPYEFASRLTQTQTPHMIGGGLGPYAPGEYSDDTQMAVCIARALADHPDKTIDNKQLLNAIATNFLTWRDNGATDIGAQTATVLRNTDRTGRHVADSMLTASREYWATGRPAAGNGALMRTAPLGLYELNDAASTANAARRVAELTHADPLAGDACVIWTEGIRHAVQRGDFGGIRQGVKLLPQQRRDWWNTRLDEAEAADPHTFTNNGFVVSALQAAWSAITRTPVPTHDPAQGTFAADHFRLALEAAVRAGHDTDTVAAIAGSLLGAHWGASAIPWHWQRIVHGWPNITSRDLTGLGTRLTAHYSPDMSEWPIRARQPRHSDALAPFQVPHPHDDGVILGNLALADLDPADLDVDAVVSLCRTGTDDFAHIPNEDHIKIWLVDRVGANRHVHFALDQAARAVHTLRAEGKRVLLHCAAGRSRTPTAGARYSGLLGIEPATAMKDIRHALAPNKPWVNIELEDTVFDLDGRPRPDRGPLLARRKTDKRGRERTRR
ncbi:ADP-ribosylglycohydrolase family protein [Nocardiopsis dassonvillei]|uniref:ADP-ribosylglycohydrolase family protein n=1 Tax=Nocardiopsis dassonvillei TaxID=2014 RepID=UPI00200EAB30|nr:ADP-ribosylglycohydrolase family protein [Nocardiopsis dassonvillei]MCK9871653.1 ADP-ribosylglycohydrolase family protein [Nocardiopsis dassonvillei]